MNDALRSKMRPTNEAILKIAAVMTASSLILGVSLFTAALVFVASFWFGYGSLMVTLLAVGLVVWKSMTSSFLADRQKHYESYAGKVHEWIRNAPLVHVEQVNGKYESIDRIHGRKEVRNQVLRLEDLLLDLYVKPWFFHLTSTEISTHLYNSSPVFVENDLTSRHPIMANLREQALVNGAVIRKSSLFLTCLRYYFRTVLLELKARIARIDWTSFIMELVIPLVTQHIHDYKRAVQEVNQQGNRNLTASEELDLLTASVFRQGRLHVALGANNSQGAGNKSRLSSNGLLPISTVQSEYDYLRHQFDHIIPKLLPVDESSVFLHCILREIVIVFLMQPILSMLAEPDFWNQKIDAFAAKAIKEQKIVTKLREALDKPFMDEQSGKLKIPPKMPSFEKYLEIIKGCKNLLDLKRIHNSLFTEIQRKQGLVYDKNDRDIVNGRRIIDLKKYIHRLKIALRKTEKKIIDIGGTVGNEAPSPNENSRCASPFRSPVPDSPAIDYSDIQNLLVEPGLSYFREYIENSDEIDILQLYCSVQALSTHMSETSGRISPFSISAIGMIEFETKKILRNDIISIYFAYLLDGHSLITSKLDLDKSDIRGIFGNIESAKIASDGSISAALEYLKGVQVKARNYLQMFCSSFQQSDAYYRLLSDPNRIFLEAERKDISPITRKRLTSTLSRSSDSKMPKLTIDTSLPTDTASVTRMSDMSRSGEINRRSPPIAMISPSIAHGRDSHELFANSFAHASPSFGTRDPDGPHILDDSISQEIGDSEDYDAVHLVQMEIESIIEKESHADELSDDEDDRIEFSEDEELSPEYNDEDSDETESDEEGAEIVKSHNHQTKVNDTSAKYEADLKRIDASLAKIRQQKILLQYMDENPNAAETKNQYREQKLLRKMRFQFEQEEKILENEKRQLQWKIDGTLIIPGQTKVSIPNLELVDSQVKSKRPFVIYFIEIRQPRQSFADLEQTGWMMVRRYSEFHALHRHLKEAFPDIMNKSKIEFPGKRFITSSRVKSALFSSSNQSLNDPPSFTSTKDQEFIENRRRDLEAYLSKITMEPDIAKSWIFRQFLCDDKQYTFKGMTMLPIKTSLSNMFTGLSSRFKIERMKPKEPRKKKAALTMISPEIINEDEAAVDNDGIFEFSQNKGAETLSSLLLELFDLNEKSNWWRRQAIMWVMQQFLGGTFERRISEFIEDIADDEHLTFYLTSLNDMMETWSSNTSTLARSQTEKTRSRLSVYKKLNLLIPDMTSSIVGRANAKRGSNRLFDLLQNRRLNQDLIYRATDLMFKKMFNTNH